MKKILFAAFAAAVALTSCGNRETPAAVSAAAETLTVAQNPRISQRNLFPQFVVFFVAVFECRNGVGKFLGPISSELFAHIFFAVAIVKIQCVVRTEFVAYRLICLMLAVNVVYKAVTLIALNCGFAK